MELRQLRYFIAVAEELNFTKAARRLQIAQPPLSRQIQGLETEIGVRLLDRNSSRVFLTDAGLRFLHEARTVLQHASRAVEIARQAKDGELGTVRIGFGKGLGDIVSRVIHRYLRLFPGVEIDVKDIVSGFQTKAVVAREIDVGFSRPPIDSLELSSKQLFEERMSVVLRRSSPLAKRRHLRLKHLEHEPLLLIHRNISPGAYDRTIELYRQCGLAPKIVPTQTMPYDEAGAILVESGKGIYLAVGKNPCHPSFADRLIALPLMEPTAKVGVHIVWRTDEQAKLVLNFVEFTRQMFANVPAIVDMSRDADSIFGLGSRTGKRPSSGTRQTGGRPRIRERSGPGRNGSRL
jgi:DNA-binding transcriptional LysR family regulator